MEMSFRWYVSWASYLDILECLSVLPFGLFILPINEIMNFGLLSR